MGLGAWGMEQGARRTNEHLNKPIFKSKVFLEPCYPEPLDFRLSDFRPQLKVLPVLLRDIKILVIFAGVRTSLFNTGFTDLKSALFACNI